MRTRMVGKSNMATGTSVTSFSPDFLSSCSDYVKELDKISFLRYKEKLQYNKGTKQLPDPYGIKGGWSDKTSFWPDVTFGDIYLYLIETPGIYTKESMKAFKSLEAYQFFLSGHVKTLLCHPMDETVPFCIIKGSVIPSQRLNDKSQVKLSSIR